MPATQRTLLLVPGLCFIVLLGACDEQTSPPASPPLPLTPAVSPETVALTVNGTPVTEGDIVETMQKFARSAGAPLEALPGNIRDSLRQRAQDHVVSRLLLRQHAIASGKNVTPEEVEERLTQVARGLSPDAKLVDVAGAFGIAPDAVRSQLETDLLVQKLHEELQAQVKPSEEAIKQFYDQNLQRFTTAEQVSASHILLRLPVEASPEHLAVVEAKAKEIARQAREGDAEAFKALATAESQDPSVGFNHGDLGFFDHDAMAPEFAAAAFALKPGEVSDPVKTRFGYHIIRGQGGRPAGQRKLEEVREQIVQEIVARTSAAKLDELVEKLKAEAKIVRPGPGGVMPATPASAPSSAPAATSAPTTEAAAPVGAVEKAAPEAPVKLVKPKGKAGKAGKPKGKTAKGTGK